jgi:hypothetical protein
LKGREEVKTLIYFILTSWLLLSPVSSIADENEYVELESRYSKLHTSYVINDDFSVERISEIEIKALSKRAANNLKKRRFSHSTSIEEFEVLEAYTLKANGDRIEVPHGNYQVTVNKGNGDKEAIFSDRTVITIVFPDFEKNDSVHMKLKNVETEPMFPNHFSASQYFWSQNAYDDVKVSFDLPKALAFKHQVRGMKEKTSTINERKIIELTYHNKKPVKNKRADFGVWDEAKEAGFAISTFKDYSEVSKAYGDRALPKAIPTARVKELAAKIISKEKDKKQRARLLYDWVATNISYAGNCIGVGAVVPHNTDLILDNRMGDCKDHATLLHAFYSSVGIKSTQALINSGNSYALPEIPTVSAVNHVINYIPEWDMFIDSTNPSMPFDRISMSISDKPVILVDNYILGKTTPRTQFGDNYQEIVSTMKFQPDGSVLGDIHITLKGHPAIDARRSWRHATQQQEDQWLESISSSQGKIGSATMKKDDPAPLLSEYSYSVEFDRPKFILPKGTGGFYIGPILNASMSLYTMLDYSKEEIEGYDVVCGNGTSIERLIYEFPDGMKILAKPDNFEIRENHIHFKATYELNKNGLKVIREVNDKTPGNTCSAELINLQRETLMKISENLKVQVIYQH